MSLQTIQLLSKPKSLLLIPVTEFKELVKRENRISVIVGSSERIVDVAYEHFSKDESDLIDLNEGISEGNYTFLPGVYDGVIRRLDIMNFEVSSYRKFRSYVLPPLLEESKELRKLVKNTNLLTDVIESDIKKAKVTLNRRVY